MAKHLFREIEKLKGQILSLGDQVEAMVRLAISGVTARDADSAQNVINKDNDIDRLEVEVEEECLKLLALYQPVAIDLRFIIAVLKINNDLERIGDLAVNIAWRAQALAKLGPPVAGIDFAGMAGKVQTMLHLSLEALVKLDFKLAKRVLSSDDEIDRLNSDTHKKVRDTIKAKPQCTEELLLELSVSRHLERIADHATNIAEDVIYMIDGTIVRHGLGKVE